MGDRMTKEQGEEFRRRWELINNAEIEELRRTPIDVKFRQLCVLFEAVDELGWREALASEEEVVRERWLRLRKHYNR